MKKPKGGRVTVAPTDADLLERALRHRCLRCDSAVVAPRRPQDGWPVHCVRCTARGRRRPVRRFQGWFRDPLYLWPPRDAVLAAINDLEQRLETV